MLTTSSTPLTDDEPVHPKPRDFAPVEPPAAPVESTAAPSVTEPSAAEDNAAERVAGDTVVASSVVGSAAAAAEPVASSPAVEAPVAAPAEAMLRAQPVMRAERIHSPALVAKVVPVAKTIPTAEPAHVAKPAASAAPIAKRIAQPVDAPIAQPVESHSAHAAAADAERVVERPAVRPAPAELDPNLVPLTALGRGLWHFRNLLIASNISMLLHIGIMVALGSIMLHAPDKPKPPPVLEISVATTMVIKPEPPKIETIEIAPVKQTKSTAAAKGNGSGSDGSKGGVGGGNVGGLHLNPIKIDTVAKLTSGGSGFGTDTAYGSDMLGEVGEMLDPKDAKAEFFGVEAKGKSFVFVVDTSGSMMQNDRYLRCRTELLRSIGALKYQQKYYVVFFNHTTFPMPEHKLVEARPAQITKTQEWCKLAIPAGGTDPWDGLAQALHLKPDAIYLLTDGDFNPAVVERLAHAQPQTKKIPIHTICFESLSGAPVMEAIAKQTNGSYLYVP